MNSNKYNIILIGDNLSMYMASIYLQTSNYKQLVININEPDNLNFEGFDKVEGVINIKDQADLLERMRQQTKNLKVPIIKEEIKNIKK
ncbi:thioredoxin reductase [Vairimorpha necatrix]|uniref:Thioredoxin reductase n=1 Tax=Vairimorpha necatrix TaxID=6039 RepID=A0AAX4JD64_9MICR